MSPRNKSRIPRGTRVTSTTDNRNSSAKLMSLHTPTKSPTSVPSLPDVNKAVPSGGGFLHTLMGEEETGRGARYDVSANVSRSSSRSKGKEGHGQHVYTPPPDGFRERLLQDTLMTRSDKLLTASWPASRGDPDHDEPPPRAPAAGNQGKLRHSRDSESSARRLSGPQLPSRKRFRHRLSPGSDARQQATRRFSSPAAPSSSSEITPALSFQQKTEVATLVVCLGEESLEGSLEAAPAGSALDDRETGLSEKAAQGSSETAQLDDSAKYTNTEQNYKHSVPKSCSDIDSAVSHITPHILRLPTITNTALTTEVHLGNSPTSEPFNQWTVCRALDDTDDKGNDEEDNDKESQCFSRASEADIVDLLCDDGSVADGMNSRMTSSIPGRRKRPLLLPPIMLPPIYTMKPTPLIVRDDVYFTKLGARARRPLTEDEWDKLIDCRYLRIRTLRWPLKV